MESENVWPANRVICRICLRTNVRCCDIFNTYYVSWEKKDMQILYSDMLAHCTRAEIHAKDGLPPFMCRNCIMHLEDIMEFHMECRKVDRNFRRLLSVR